MAQIKAAQVNELRQKTGAGMMDCKNALVEADGDFDKAISVLRKKGQKIAEKRADRDSSEGAVIAKVNDAANRGVIISLNCETDFVSKNDSFVAMAHELAAIALNTDSIEAFLASDFGGITVQEKLTEQTGVIGEKIEIGGFKILEAPFVGSYIHGNKIGALVGLTSGVSAWLFNTRTNTMFPFPPIVIPVVALHLMGCSCSAPSKSGRKRTGI